MSNCQDNYCATFRNYPSLLLYQEEQATRSQWERHRVKDLRVEPLDKAAPLYSDLSSFASGVSRDAVEDTAKNLGLAMRMAEGCYPIRDTAYKSLLGRAKISGSALPKLKRDTLASVLNARLGLYGAEALLLIRDEKVTAVHADDAADYSVLPVNELLRALQNKLDKRFPGSKFENGYLSSGQIKGIGPKMAERLYDAFGLQALEVLDKEPERLLEVKGITESKLEKIKSSYLMNRGARDVIAFLAPHGVSPNRAVKLYQEYKGQTMDIVKNHPYRLCELAGIGFKTADTIAYSMGFDRLSAERVDAALLYTLTEAEENGHLCMEKHAFINACLKLLDTEGLTMMAAANRAAKLVENGQLVSFGKYVYRTKTAHAESHLAQRIRQFVRVQVQGIKTLDNELSQEEARLGVQFAPEQREAIKMALSHSLSIITGGPGTGKTMIQRAILDIYKRHDPEEKICYCAPTGRAARRMEDSTGFPASTIHRALNLMPGEEGGQNSPEPIDAKLVLVDEVSMLDIYLANKLLDAVMLGSRLVLIGDADQLPSVGTGAVLSEMITSGCVPVVRLDKVFRQEAGSRIAANAKLIRNGYKTLEWGEDFAFVESPSIEGSAEKNIKRGVPVRPLRRGRRHLRPVRPVYGHAQGAGTQGHH